MAHRVVNKCVLRVLVEKNDVGCPQSFRRDPQGLLEVAELFRIPFQLVVIPFL